MVLWFRRVHGANKLVRKHERVALNPLKNTVQCDICQASTDQATCYLMLFAFELSKTLLLHSFYSPLGGRMCSLVSLS